MTFECSIQNGFVNQRADLLASNCCSCAQWQSPGFPGAGPPPYVLAGCRSQCCSEGAVLVTGDPDGGLRGRSYCRSQRQFRQKELGSVAFLF